MITWPSLMTYKNSHTFSTKDIMIRSSRSGLHSAIMLNPHTTKQLCFKGRPPRESIIQSIIINWNLSMRQQGDWKKCKIVAVDIFSKDILSIMFLLILPHSKERYIVGSSLLAFFQYFNNDSISVFKVPRIHPCLKSLHTNVYLNIINWEQEGASAYMNWNVVKTLLKMTSDFLETANI